MDTTQDFLFDQAELEIGGGGEVLIHFGQLSVHAVKIERQLAQEHLAWVHDRDGREMLFDIRQLYAIEVLKEGD